MLHRKHTALLTLAFLVSGPTISLAAPETLAVAGTVSVVEGDYVGDFTVGDPYSGSFTYDTDEANASFAITTPSTVPGHEFSSFYDFTAPVYEAILNFPAIPGTFTSNVMAVVVNDNLTLTTEDTAGAIPAGTYDWIEILGSTTVGACLLPGGECEPDEFSPVDGEEWTLAIFSSDTTWITDGSLIPNNLPGSYTAIIVGAEFDELGEEVGFVLASASVTEPVPMFGPFGLAMLAVSFLLIARIQIHSS
jgi:hypothetical protein